MDPGFCPSPDQSCMVCSSVASAERTASASTGPGQWLGEVCCSHMREEELSCLLPPMEVPSSLCQGSMISWLLFKGSQFWFCPSHSCHECAQAQKKRSAQRGGCLVASRSGFWLSCILCPKRKQLISASPDHIWAPWEHGPMADAGFPVESLC